MTQIVAAHILCSETDPRHAAASYLSWLAYPERKKAQKGAEFFEAVVAGAYKAAGRHPPPAFRMKRERAVSKINAGLRRIGKRRIPAARMAVEMMQIDGMSSFAAARSLQKLADEGGRDNAPDVGNILRDVWKETLPAIPMAMAMTRHLVADRWKVSDLIERPDWVPDAVAWADEFCEPLAEKFGLSAVFRPILVKSPVS